ncbi:MAG: hypothetical protein ACM33T_17810 [Solirubrobacterales bacterium]
MRRVVVHSLDEARAALSQAGEVTIETPPGAAALHGIGWWREILDILAEEFPGRTFTAILDCAGLPGLAMAAIRDGIPAIRFAGTAAVTEKIAALAEAAGVRLVR